MESGLRRSEIAALDLGDIDLKQRTVTVRRGKGGRSRTSTFGDLTAQALHRWMRTRGSHQRAGDLEALFTNYRYLRLSPSGVGQLLVKLGHRAGVEGLRPHLFRHAWCHYMLEDGVQETNVMTLAG
jgi:integrase/recombinase XerD